MAEIHNSCAIYEIDYEAVDGVMAKSINSNTMVWLRFINKTSRPVDVWWRNYKGQRQFYERIEPNETYKLISYLTHPFEFLDPSTNENYVINNKPIFRAPAVIGGMKYFTDWYITVPVRSLRHTTLLVLASRIDKPIDTFSLSNEKAEEIKKLVSCFQKLKPPPPYLSYSDLPPILR